MRMIAFRHFAVRPRGRRRVCENIAVVAGPPPGRRAVGVERQTEHFNAVGAGRHRAGVASGSRRSWFPRPLYRRPGRRPPMTGAREAEAPHRYETGFRPDIEGLRAIAVLGVLGFYAALPFMSGGYVGVDVFFVISGFLITGLLLADIEKHGRFSLTRFYARRARRILPAAG